MGDRRPYTGTQRLQLTWTGLAVISLGSSFQLPVGVDPPVVVAVVGIGWILGLVMLGLRERRHWNRLVERVSFQEGGGTSLADLEKLLGDRSVYVETNMPGLFSQTHTEITTRVQDVDAAFTVDLTYVGTGGTSGGVQTGTAELDERFLVRGRKENVERILSPDVQATLLGVETPGTCTVTSETVVYDVPFTRLSATELEAIADVVVAIARRVEEVGRRNPERSPPA